MMKNMFNYQGRATRREYWMSMLWIAIIAFGEMVGLVLFGCLLDISEILDNIIALLMLVMLVVNIAIALASLALTVRRYHDLGKSVWYFLLICLVSIFLVGIIIHIVLMCCGSGVDNRWGPNPKGNSNMNNGGNDYYGNNYSYEGGQAYGKSNLKNKKIFDFQGRATRFEYWMTMLNCFLVYVFEVIAMVLLTVFSREFENETLFWSVFAIMIMLIILLDIVIACLCIPVTVRRYHDIGKPGLFVWLMYLLCLTGIGLIIHIIFMCMDSEPDNQWGPNPKGNLNMNDGGNNQGYGNGQLYGNQQGYGMNQPYGNQQSYDMNQPYGNNQGYDMNQSYGSNQSYAGNQNYGFGQNDMSLQGFVNNENNGYVQNSMNIQEYDNSSNCGNTQGMF